MRISEELILTEFKERWPELLGIADLKLSVSTTKGLDDDMASPDCFLHLYYHDLKIEFATQIMSEPRSHMFNNKILALKLFIQNNSEYTPLIVGEYLSPKRRSVCTENGINWLDLSGNAYIKYRSLLIDRTGFSSRRPPKHRGRNPFSDKASLILREAFKEKDKTWRVREMARATHLDPGFISRILKELEGRGYAKRNKAGFKIIGAQEILAEWVAAYNYRKNQELRYFCLATSTAEILDRLRNLELPTDFNFALSLQAGVSLILPGAQFRTVHIYLEKEADVEYLEEPLMLSKVEDGANVGFLVPYYKNCVFRDMQRIAGLRVVSDLQLYLDLYHFPGQGREKAQAFFDKRLASTLIRPDAGAASA